MDPYGPYDSISLTNYLHRRGINIRLLGGLEDGKPVKGLIHTSGYYFWIVGEHTGVVVD